MTPMKPSTRQFNFSRNSIDEILTVALRDEASADRMTSLNELSIAAYAETLAQERFQSLAGFIAAVKTIIRSHEITKDTK